MGRFTLLLNGTTMAIVLVAASAGATARAEEVEGLRGKWRLISYVIEGRNLSEQIAAEGGVWVLEPPKLRIEARGTVIPFEISLDNQANPKHFDAKYVGDDPALKRVYGESLPGIYELEGDILRRCLVIPGRKGTRPDSFDIETGSGRLLIVLERIKAEPAGN